LRQLRPAVVPPREIAETCGLRKSSLVVASQNSLSGTVSAFIGGLPTAP
jgi:hypothetical protein